MSHESVPHEADRDELAAYSLGALGPEEMSALERHLDECDACREYLRWLDPAVNTLPSSVEQLKPPKRLKRELMATVREEASQADPQPRRSLFDFGWRPAAALAACVLVAAGIAGGYALRGDSAGETETIAFAQTEGPPASADVELEVDGDQGKVVVSGMDPLPDDRVYQLWRQVDGEMVPSTVFVVHQDGTGEVAVEGSLDDADAVLVTVEPKGGSSSPTSDPLMQATLS